MPLNFRTELKKEYFYAKIEGQFDLESMISAQNAIMEEGANHKTTKILVDFREMTGEISTNERFQFAEAGSVKYLQLLTDRRLKICRFAYLGKVPQLDPQRYGETVAVNRGVLVRATDSIHDAFEWLGVEPDLKE